MHDPKSDTWWVYNTTLQAPRGFSVVAPNLDSRGMVSQPASYSADATDASALTAPPLLTPSAPLESKGGARAAVASSAVGANGGTATGSTPTQRAGSAMTAKQHQRDGASLKSSVSSGPDVTPAHSAGASRVSSHGAKRAFAGHVSDTPSAAPPGDAVEQSSALTTAQRPSGEATPKTAAELYAEAAARAPPPTAHSSSKAPSATEANKGPADDAREPTLGERVEAVWIAECAAVGLDVPPLKPNTGSYDGAPPFHFLASDRDESAAEAVRTQQPATSRWHCPENLFALELTRARCERGWIPPADPRGGHHARSASAGGVVGGGGSRMGGAGAAWKPDSWEQQRLAPSAVGAIGGRAIQVPPNLVLGPEIEA
jgi:hypothetical protein